MRLQGLHHVTMVAGDAPATVTFYAEVLGLRLVKQTVNFDAPDAYHLYFGDERGSPGSILTWFEFAGAERGRAGAGMIHLIQLGVASEASLDFWAGRLGDRGHTTSRRASSLWFEDPDGLALELVVAKDGNPPLRAVHPEVPEEHALLGVEGARAYESGGTSRGLLADTLGFDPEERGTYRLAGEARHFHWSYDRPPEAHGRQGAGTVHHIAWACEDADQRAWQERVADAGAHVTPIIDRDYFHSIYFREPSGVLFEIATLSPGFSADEDPDHLGEELRLPTQHEHLRGRLERLLTPLENPRAKRRAAAPVAEGPS